MPNVKLIFDHSNRKYNPGDVINLEVCLHSKSKLKLQLIYVEIKGFAYVSITETVFNTTVTYYVKESFFELHQILAGSRSGMHFLPLFNFRNNVHYSDNYNNFNFNSTVLGPKIRLPAGSHIYKTSFTLPQNLPENYESKYGHIRYKAKVHVVLPWKFDVTDRSPFYITPHYDLQEFPHLREPVCVEAVKTFGFFGWWQSEPMRTYISLPRSGFVPGDHVRCTLILQNESDVAIHSANVTLVQKMVYSVGEKSREKNRTLWSHKFTGGNGRNLVSAMQHKECAVDLYFDPLWDYHYFTGCTIITVEHYIMCRARTSIWHTDLSNCTRIHVGTVHL